mmetsp:Transcript_862/g.3158  ORF Transcript_862/g.3158 Transcript_862/m.3158 type:complete len:257 (-) Transcript_862:43-813(-)
MAPRATLSRYCCVLTSVLFLTCVVYFLLSFVTSSKPPEYPEPAAPTAREMRKYYTQVERRMMDLQVANFTTVRDLRDRCALLTEKVQLEDVNCRAELMLRLRSLLPSRIHSALRFLDDRTGTDWFAFELTMGEDVRAWFKPCACGDVEVAGRQGRRAAPIEPRGGYPAMLAVSTRLDPRFLRTQSFGMSDWARWVIAASHECGEELPFSKSHNFPRLPGCLMLWNNATAHHFENTGTDLNHVLQSLTCERVQLDSL